MEYQFHRGNAPVTRVSSDQVCVFCDLDNCVIKIFDHLFSTAFMEYLGLNKSLITGFCRSILRRLQ